MGKMFFFNLKKYIVVFPIKMLHSIKLRKPLLKNVDMNFKQAK